MLKKLLFISAFVFISYKVSASQEVLKNFDSQLTNQSSWQSLIKTIHEKGKVLTSDFGDYLFIENKTKNSANSEIKANYISLVGYNDHSGKFIPVRIEGVHETWTLDKDNNWQIDQWLFKITDQGSLNWGAHMLLVEKKDGTVLKHEYLEASDQELKNMLDQKLEEWYLFIQKK